MKPALKDIKGRIYSENWSMNYREGEILLKCIEAANALTDKQSIDTDEDCKKFVFEVNKNSDNYYSLCFIFSQV